MSSDHFLPMGLDADAINKIAASMRPKEEARPRLDLRQLDALERDLKNMEWQREYRQNNVTLLGPDVSKLEQTLATKKDALKHLEKELSQMNLRVDSDGGGLDKLREEIRKTEQLLAAAKERLELNKTCAASWVKLIKEWPHHSDLAELRAAQKVLDKANSY